MAKTAAERQADYRAKRPLSGANGNGERRINTWIGTRAHLGLERLSKCYGVTKREMIERLVLAEDDRIIAGPELDSAAWGEYFGNDHVTT